MHDLARIGAVWAEAAAEDLTGLLGREITLSGPHVLEGAPDRILPRSGTLVHTACTSSGPDAVELAFMAPLPAALSLAALQLGRDPGALDGAALEGEAAEAHRTVMDLCVGILSRVLDEEAELPSVSMSTSTLVELPPGLRSPLTADGYRRGRFDLAIEGGPKSTLDLLIPSDSAVEWFGPGGAAPREHVSADRRIAIVDPALADRDEIDALSEALGCEVLTLTPGEIDEDIVEDLEECAALILAWDLGGQGGLEVVELLRRDPRTVGLPIGLSSEAPTPAMVSAALRWGAVTFLCTPYVAEEIEARLLERPIGA